MSIVSDLRQHHRMNWGVNNRTRLFETNDVFQHVMQTTPNGDFEAYLIAYEKESELAT